MVQIWLHLLLAINSVFCYPDLFEKKNFKIGIEYDHSLPMTGGSDRYRHRNNYDPFFVTITAKSRTGYVITYLEVSATIDLGGDLQFHLIRGGTGAATMTFQLVSNHSDFLSYSYLTYGIREEDYKKLANIITIPIGNYGARLQSNGQALIAFIFSIILILFRNI